jgi:hypothetical protein
MTTRFFTNLAIALFGGFIVVASLAFTHADAAWVAFGFAIAVLAITLAAQLDRARSLEQRIMDVFMVAVSGTMVGVSVAFTGTTVMWLVFALALGWLAISVSGLSLREVGVWRAEHGLAELRPFGRVLELRSHAAQPAPGQAAMGSRIA